MKNKYYLIALLLFIAVNATSQQRLHWSVPDFGVTQVAGSIGDFSTGFGYDVFKDKARFSTHFGIVHLKYGGILKVISTKLFFKPSTVTVWNRVHINLVDIGLMASYSFGGNVPALEPEGTVPNGYYWWYPALRAHFGMESSITYEFKKEHPLRSITTYIELNTNEIYFVRIIKDIKTVSFWDIIKIGTGVRIYF